MLVVGIIIMLSQKPETLIFVCCQIALGLFTIYTLQLVSKNVKLSRFLIIVNILITTVAVISLIILLLHLVAFIKGATCMFFGHETSCLLTGVAAVSILFYNPVVIYTLLILAASSAALQHLLNSNFKLIKRLSNLKIVTISYTLLFLSFLIVPVAQIIVKNVCLQQSTIIRCSALRGMQLDVLMKLLQPAMIIVGLAVLSYVIYMNYRRRKP
jgi:hypothetical protein